MVVLESEKMLEIHQKDPYQCGKDDPLEQN